MKAWHIYIISLITIPFLITFFLEPVGTISEYDFVSALIEVVIIGGVVLILIRKIHIKKHEKTTTKA